MSSRPPRRPARLAALGLVVVLLALGGASLAVEERPHHVTAAASESHSADEAEADDPSSTVEVAISSCRGGAGIVTAGFAVTKRSSLHTLDAPSDYIVRIKVTSEAGPIGEAVTVVSDVHPDRPKEAQAYASIGGTSRTGPVLTNCFLKDVQRIAGT